MAEVSVIIPTFNRKALLLQTLKNIMNQTSLPDEVIVVDDHSTDGTEAAVREVFGSRIIFVKNSGRGPGAARNAGLKNSQGRYIKFFDSDDLMTANTIQVQYDLLKDSGKQFVYSPYFRAQQDGAGSWMPLGHIIMHYHPFHRTLPLWDFMLKEGLFIAIPGMLFRRELLEKAGPWKEDATAYEDWDYLFRISILEPHPLHTNACAFVYRIHGTQTTMRNFSDEQRDLDKNKVLEHLDNLISQDNRFSAGTKAFFRNKFYQLYRETPSVLLKDKLKKYDTLLQRFLWEYLRLKLKIGRIKTKTMWQPSHGPFTSEEVVKNYLNHIKV